MNSIKKARDSYLNRENEIEVIYNRIEERQKQIQRLNNKKDKLQAKSFWGDLLIRPIMELVKEKYPEIQWDDDRLTPMGLCARISLFGEIKGKTIILCFTPSDLLNGIIAYDTEERTAEYPKGSIGYYNDINKVSEEIVNIEQIFIHIEKQL
jgi:hypothetical protein